jgi:hypothetical protein
MNLRPLFPSLRLDDTPAQHVSKKVIVRHPAYKGQNNVLTSLLAADGPDGGLDLATVHTICAIMADNRFDGYLAHQSDPTSLAMHVQILPPGEYFFHVPSNTEVSESGDATVDSPSAAYCYPVVAFFDSWAFPHANIPTLWQRAESATPSVLRPTNTTVVERDRTCRLTNQRLGCELAHVVPKSEEEWFLRNGMGMQYGSLGRREASGKLDEPENVMLLRSDIHKAWDDRSFVFVPKQNSSSTRYRHEDDDAPAPDCSLVAHVMHQDEEMMALFHNVKSQALSVRSEYLFARLAWSIFPAAQNFLSSGEKRLLKVWNGNTGTAEVRWFTGKECSSLLQSRQRSRSPTKRARSDGAAIEDEGDSPKRLKRWSSESSIRDSFDSGVCGLDGGDAGKSGGDDRLEDAIRVAGNLQHYDDDDEDFVLEVHEIRGRCRSATKLACISAGL